MEINTVNTSYGATFAADLKPATAPQPATEPASKLEARLNTTDETAQSQDAAEAEHTDLEQLQKIATDLSDMMSVMRKGLAFEVDDTLDIPVVSVMDMDSGEVIRQIPNAEALELAQKLSDVAGLLVKTEA
ncbi:flagellar protein FlaG [Shewanella salipaludis]|uniref:Flagellar protein FlaG n=1 Tax=Shewanella salipaludis TaxID=2723052 RepID=A0A972FYG7_9GAMM|nr:flagellar protein FlaG [Shewanella salipaludis]NMH65548.1 flagellar protein FlaG [Shewanella salipaludis]